MSSTAMRIKNSSDIPTVEASINIGAGYGSTTVTQGNWGSIDCEFVWYTLNCYNKDGHVMLSGKSGCYGHGSYELTGSGGNYSISKV